MENIAVNKIEKLTLEIKDFSISENVVLEKLNKIQVGNIKSFDDINVFYPFVKILFDLGYNDAFLYVMENANKKFLLGFVNNNEIFHRYYDKIKKNKNKKPFKNIFEIVNDNLNESNLKIYNDMDKNSQKLKSVQKRGRILDFYLKNSDNKTRKEKRTEFYDLLIEMSDNFIDEIIEKIILYDEKIKKIDDKVNNFICEIKEEHNKIYDLLDEKLKKKLINKSEYELEIEELENKYEEDENDLYEQGENLKGKKYEKFLKKNKIF